MLSSLRQRLNKARRLHPVLCLKGVRGSVYGMRSVSDQSKNVQVRVRTSPALTTISKGKVITKMQYHCQVERVTGTGMQQYYGPHEMEYAIASALKEISKEVKFTSKQSTALLKQKIYGGQLIEVKSGAKSVYGVAY